MEQNEAHFMVTVEMDYDLIIYERIYYTALDLLSDIGGIQAIVFGLFSLLISIVKHDNFEDYLV